MGFYEIGSDTYYIESDYWATDRKMLAEAGCELLDVSQANQFNLASYFTKADKEVKPKPNLDFNYFVLPYELDDALNSDLDAGDVCMQIIKDNLKANVFIASTDSDKCCVIKCPTVNENVIYHLANVHVNTPFVVFDDSSTMFLLIDFDLPLQIIGYKGSIIDSHHYVRDNISEEAWQTLFTRYGSYINMPKLLRESYFFLLPDCVKRLLTHQL